MSQASTVLIVDKDQAVIRLLKTVLSNAGHQVVLASSDEEILEIMKKETVDAALIDYGIKDSNGIETARKISQEHPDVPIALVAYYGTARSGLTANDAGVRRFLLKPFDDLASVGRTIREILDDRKELLRRNGKGPAEDQGADAEESGVGVRAVVADTSDADRRQIGEALVKLGCEVTYATCAQEALLRLNDRDHEILIVGYDMGDMTADDVLLRAKRIDQDIAVIVTAQRPSLQMTTALLKRGAAAFIEKPLADADRTARAICNHGLAVLDLRTEDQDDEEEGGAADEAKEEPGAKGEEEQEEEAEREESTEDAAEGDEAAEDSAASEDSSDEEEPPPQDDEPEDEEDKPEDEEDKPEDGEDKPEQPKADKKKGEKP